LAVIISDEIMQFQNITTSWF